MYELYDPCTIMFFFRNKVRNKKKRPSSQKAAGALVQEPAPASSPAR